MLKSFLPPSIQKQPQEKVEKVFNKEPTKIILTNLENGIVKKYQLKNPHLALVYNLAINTNQSFINDNYTGLINSSKTAEDFLLSANLNKAYIEKNSLQKLHKWQQILHKLKKNHIRISAHIPKLNKKTKAEKTLNAFHQKYGKFLPVIVPSCKPRVTSKYGMRCHPISKKRCFHSGIDLASSKFLIFAAAEGVVSKISNNGNGYGNNVTIDHLNGIRTFYAHLDQILVSENQRVMQGELIGIEGKTGKATGIHLHFEVLYKNKRINPDYFFLLNAK